MANVVVTATGPLYTLEEAKQHLHVDGTDDDAVIAAYMEAAEAAVLQYCNIPIVPLGKEAVFKVAALIALSDLYENRSGLAGIPNASKALVNPYRWLRV